MKVVSRTDLETLSKFTVDGGKYAGMKLGDYFDDVEQEAYTKEEVITMLTDIQLDIEELKSYESADGQDLAMLADIGTLFQQKFNSIKSEVEPQESEDKDK